MDEECREVLAGLLNTIEHLITNSVALKMTLRMLYDLEGDEDERERIDWRVLPEIERKDVRGIVASGFSSIREDILQGRRGDLLRLPPSAEEVVRRLVESIGNLGELP
jgi:hypothetical protein